MGGNGSYNPAGPLSRVFENNPVPATPLGLTLPAAMCRLVVPVPLLAERDANSLTEDEFGNLRIGPPLGGALIPAARNRSEYLRTDKDTQLNGAIAQNSQVTTNLTGASRNFGVIESITLFALQNLDWEFTFWTRDTFSNADMDLDTFIDSQLFVMADGVTIGNAQPTFFRYAAHGLHVVYQDQDATNEVHLGLIPRSAAKLAGGAGGDVVVILGFRADGP